MPTKTLCIYHASCADGFTAAWVVRRALGDQVEFHPGKYQEPPPDVTDKDVILVDFSYKRPVLEQMARQAKSILVLDHHKSAQEDLADCCNINIPSFNVSCVFDMNRSGARIAWDWFFPHEAPPQLLLHVEDRDLWRFALPYTREIQANLFSYPYDFSTWDHLMAADIDQLRRDGYAIERKHFKDIAELLPTVTRDMQIGGYTVPVANLPYIFSSDAGHQLAQTAPFAACYWDTPKGRVFSLRSTDAGVDVSEVAKQYGGGGHRNAAGFTVCYAQAQEFEQFGIIGIDSPLCKGTDSDGYHTFDELYDHRYALFIALMRSHPEISWRANNHDDGSMYEGMFIAGMHLSSGDISYHLPMSMWEALDNYGIPTSLRAPPWDGHTSADVIARLIQWKKAIQWVVSSGAL